MGLVSVSQNGVNNAPPTILVHDVGLGGTKDEEAILGVCGLGREFAWVNGVDGTRNAGANVRLGWRPPVNENTERDDATDEG